jgi:hypothetical protein
MNDQRTILPAQPDFTPGRVEVHIILADHPDARLGGMNIAIGVDPTVAYGDSLARAQFLVRERARIVDDGVRRPRTVGRRSLGENVGRGYPRQNQCQCTRAVKGTPGELFRNRHQHGTHPRKKRLTDNELVSGQHKRRSNGRRHDSIRPFDSFPDDLIKKQIVGAIFDFEVKTHRDLSHRGEPGISGI